MAAEAIYGFIGVLLGSATTAVLTVYREWLVSSREREARQHQREQDRKDQRDTFQRQSLLALQDAVSELIKAIYGEQDRMIAEMHRTGGWPVRQWTTPTTTPWEDTNLQLQVSRARVFEEAVRDTARDIGKVARKCIYAASPDEAERFNVRLRRLYEKFNDLVAEALPRLY
jgi:hypothetical protein